MLLAEPHDHCADSSIGAGVRWEVEFGEDVADVRFSGALVDEKVFGDRRVGVALGHERQHFSLSVCEPVESPVLLGALHESCDDFRVDSTGTVCHPTEGVQEGVNLGDSVFEEVANTGCAFFEQFHGVAGFDVLGEHEDAGIGFFIAMQAIENPDLLLVRLASFFPPWTPIVMPVRSAVGNAPFWEVALSVVLILAAIYLLVGIGARVYTGALLRTEGKVKLREAWRATRP